MTTILMPMHTDMYTVYYVTAHIMRGLVKLSLLIIVFRRDNASSLIALK